MDAGVLLLVGFLGPAGGLGILPGFDPRKLVRFGAGLFGLLGAGGVFPGMLVRGLPGPLGLGLLLGGLALGGLAKLFQPLLLGLSATLAGSEEEKGSNPGSRQCTDAASDQPNWRLALGRWRWRWRRGRPW
jgi:hypothetical protein